MATDLHYYGTGKRKSAVARVYLRPGEGDVTVNGRSLADYFPSDVLKAVARQPLMVAELADRVNVRAFVKGGGSSGQAGAESQCAGGICYCTAC